MTAQGGHNVSSLVGSFIIPHGSCLPNQGGNLLNLQGFRSFPLDSVIGYLPGYDAFPNQGGKPYDPPGAHIVSSLLASFIIP